MSDYIDVLNGMEQWRRHAATPDKKPFLLVWEKSGSAGWFGYPLLEKVLTFIDGDVSSPLRDARIVLWGASAADLRDVVVTVTASNGDGDYFQRLLVVPIGDAAAGLRLDGAPPAAHLPGLETKQ